MRIPIVVAAVAAVAVGASQGASQTDPPPTVSTSLGEMAVRMNAEREKLRLAQSRTDYGGAAAIARTMRAEVENTAIRHPRWRLIKPVLLRSLTLLAGASDRAEKNPDLSDATNGFFQAVDTVMYVSGNVVPMSLAQRANDQIPPSWRGKKARASSRKSRISPRYGWVAMDPLPGVITVQGGQQVAVKTSIGWRIQGVLHGEPAGCALPYRVAVELLGKRLAHRGCR